MGEEKRIITIENLASGLSHVPAVDIGRSQDVARLFHQELGVIVRPSSRHEMVEALLMLWAQGKTLTHTIVHDSAGRTEFFEIEWMPTYAPGADGKLFGDTGGDSGGDPPLV